jgi:hypothetical protein
MFTFDLQVESKSVHTIQSLFMVHYHLICYNRNNKHIPLVLIVTSGSNIEQTANTYNMNTCNKGPIKTSKAKLKQLFRL